MKDQHRVTLEIEGMSCSMCEAHVNDALRAALSPKKVRSSHRKGEAVLWIEQVPPEERVRAALAPIGYTLKGMRVEE